MAETIKKSSAKLYEEAREFLESGNFMEARKRLGNALSLEPGEDLQSKIKASLTDLKLDKVELITGLLALALLATLYAYFGFIR